MSGRQEKKAPLSLTQHNVDGLTRGGKTAASVRRRLRFPASTKTSSSERRTEKAGPQPISRKEMTAIVKLRVPPTVRERITSTSPSAIEAGTYSSSVKETPTVAPGNHKATKD